MSKFGRKSLPSFEHMVAVKVYMKRPLLSRITELAEKTGKSRSDFMQNMLETMVFSDKGYALYMQKQARLSAAYWEYEFEKASAKSALKPTIVTLEEFDK